MYKENDVDAQCFMQIQKNIYICAADFVVRILYAKYGFKQIDGNFLELIKE